jgi:hypothetical protein
MTTRITLRGGDEDQFRRFKSAITDARGGNEPTNAEVARLMMQELQPDDLRSGMLR